MTVPEDLARSVDGYAQEVRSLREEVHGAREDWQAKRSRDWRVFGAMFAALVLLGVAVVVLGVFGYRYVNYRVDRNSDSIREQIQADCPQHKAFGEADIMPWTTKFGRDLVVFNRRAYAVKCQGKDGFGPLRPPDPDLSRPVRPSPTPGTPPGR